MQFELKTLSREAVSRTIAKAERYRLLHEPAEAESICRDALQVDPDNQDALVMLLLALTDQFEDEPSTVDQAWECAERIRDEYDRAYYSGIICERRAKAQLHHGAPRCGSRAYDGLREAMMWYERAETVRPAGNDDALLRWNACARQLEHLPVQVEGERFVPLLE